MSTRPNRARIAVAAAAASAATAAATAVIAVVAEDATSEVATTGRLLRQSPLPAIPCQSAPGTKMVCRGRSVLSTPDYTHRNRRSFLLGDRDHSFHRASGSGANFLRNLDYILMFLQRSEGVFQRDLVHVRTAHAAQSQHLVLRISGREF